MRAAVGLFVEAHDVDDADRCDRLRDHVDFGPNEILVGYGY